MQFGDVRLVVWDLDETFWQGTLSESGIAAYVPEHHELVIRLARRGVLSSICSKNDIEPVRRALSERKLWDYFVFPSIDWNAKGPRLQRLVEQVKLRPQNVLFIDDNPSNRAEAAAAVPELRVVGPEAIADLLREADALGKDDAELSRLKQYQMLQAKQADEAAAGADNLAFLRASDIQVHFEYDVIPHMERVIELINRTNQLNFTKNRLPEASEAAMADIMAKLHSLWVQAMLVRVTDKYGDYGYVGFVLRWIADAHGPGTLEHFCFSCRTLGMDVEKWVYNRIGRPNIDIAGPVVTDLLEDKPIDWIRLASAPVAASTTKPSIPEVRLVGSCETDALSQYFTTWAERCVMWTSETRAPLWARKDVTAHMLLPPELWRDAGWTRFVEACGLKRSDFDYDQAFLRPAEKGTVFIYAPWGDISIERYRHKRTGARFVLFHRFFPARVDDITEETFEASAQAAQLNAEQRAVVRRGIAALREEAEYCGLPSADECEADLRALLARFPQDARIALLAFPHTPEFGAAPRDYNAILRKTAAERGAHVFDIVDYVQTPGERESWNHYQRIVYYRLATAIMQTVTG